MSRALTLQDEVSEGGGEFDKQGQSMKIAL